MKPNAEEDSVFLPKGSVKVIPDEVPNGEYGLVINGHSLVRLSTFTGFFLLLILVKITASCCMTSTSGVCPGSEHGAGFLEDSGHVQGSDLLQGHPSAEGSGG